MQAPRCPKCGKKMVLRTARQGRYAGKQFWGCSGYPSCNGIVNIDSQSSVPEPESQATRVFRIIGGILVMALGIALARGFDVITNFEFCYGRKGSPSWMLAAAGLFLGYEIIKGEYKPRKNKK